MSSNSVWQGSLLDLPRMMSSIKRQRVAGRLTLRNNVRLGVVHLYFRDGRLINVVGTRGTVPVILADLQGWTRATLRFESGIAVSNVNVAEEHEQLFERWVTYLQARSGGQSAPVAQTQFVEGQVIAKPQAEQLIVPWEWRTLVEGTRRVSLAVAHLVGPMEAMSVLHDILDDCSSAFPAFTGLQISPSGYLFVKERSLLDRLPREDLLEGFAALIATCQYFCSPIIGELEAHKLMIQALGDAGPPLMSLGVFHVDDRLLLNGS